MSTLYLNQQIRDLEALAIEQGISADVLMARAGAATFDWLQQHHPKLDSLAICCGPGNNGGDGYVVARLADDRGIDVNLYYLTDPNQLQGAARNAAQALDDTDVTLIPYDEQTRLQGDVILDAILGTGLQREVTGLFKHCIEQINQQNKPTIAIDIPSGINADTGKVYGIAVKAQVTMTFIGEKLGLFTGDSVDYCGDVILNDLDLSAEIINQINAPGEKLQWNDCKAKLTPRARGSHKGDTGHVVVLGGEVQMPGAVRMCGEAAARVGSGLVSIGTQPTNVAAIVANRPELMVHGIAAAKDLNPLLQRASVVAIGPGLGKTSWSQAIWQQGLNSDLPKVVDADGLNLLAAAPQKREDWILTPHPGEAARLLGQSSGEIQQDRLSAAQRIQQQYGGVCVLKGAGTLILGPNQPFALCPYGNPGMATGGMGDVLTGVIAGLLAQGLPLMMAAKLGVLVHSLAADRAATHGERGLLATDLMPHLKHLVNPT